MKEYIIKVKESDLTPSEKMCLKDYHPVELVRCRDCKHYDIDFCKLRRHESSPDFSCLAGEVSK